MIQTNLWTQVRGRMRVLLLLLALPLAGPGQANCASGVFGIGTTNYGHTLGEWEVIWDRWDYGQTIISPDVNGNAVVNGAVLMPFINPGGPNTANVTLAAGQGFMLPLWGVIGNSYVDGTPNDDFINQSIFATLTIKAQMDGVTIIDGVNVMQFYTADAVAPPIPFFSYPYNAIILSQNIGMVHAPLTVGSHVLTLSAQNTQVLPPNYGGGVFALNSVWNITVTPPPSLSVVRQLTNIVVSWPQTFSGYALEETGSLSAQTNWASSGAAQALSGGRFTVTIGITNASKFYRLRKT